MTSDIFRWNPLKHHAGYIREQIAHFEPTGLKKQLNILGSSLMDLYYGPLPVLEIVKEVENHVRDQHLFPRNTFLGFLKKNGGFYTVILSDRSSWVLREGDDPDRYIHIHPGRHTLNTLRVKSSTLKTAIACHVALREGVIKEIDLKSINRVRKDILGLSPIKRIATDTLWDRVFKLLE